MSGTSARKRPGCLRSLVAGVALLAVIAAVAAGVVWYNLFRPEHPVAAGQPVHLVIEPGSSTAEIARQLVSAGVVENSLMFRLQAKHSNMDGQLKAGEYDLTTGIGYDAAIDALAAGPKIVTVDVTIPEGFTARQIAERFAERTGVPADEMLALVTSGAPEFAAEHPYLADAFNDSLEGYLFPATYTVEEGTTAREIVAMMLDEFDRRVAGLDLSYAQSKGLDLSDVVIIASILERESKLPEEYPLVSSVIYNRLAKPMRLQLCATVLYTMPPGTDKLTEADTKVDTPYNTYVHDGLPAGPISNPGDAALQAAAAPAKTDYLYYVLTGEDGSQTFTATYEEFLRAKQTYHDVYGE